MRKMILLLVLLMGIVISGCANRGGGGTGGYEGPSGHQGHQHH